MAGPNRFPSRVRHIQDGDPLTAGIASAPDKALEGRTNYLKARLDAIEAGRALVWTDQTLAPDVLEGQPVYWNEANTRWELGLAGVVECNTSGVLATLPSSDIQGLVLRKRVGNIGDIALWGVVFYADQLANAIDGPIVPGNYYLSAVTPGKMVLEKPPVSVLCCHVFGPLDNCDQNTWVYVRLMQKDFLENHIHFSYDLVALPAGDTTPPAPGERHVITNPNSDLQGWLPADNAIFNGFAPAGAVFGYNLHAHEALDRNWPPIPACASVLEMLRPAEKLTDEGSVVDRPVEFGGHVSKAKCIIDKHGIWWMTDCNGEVPWPANLDTTLASSSSSASSLSSASEAVICPLPVPMSLTLYYIKMTFLGMKTVVTSLQPDIGQPFEFVNCDGVVANTGELFARLMLALLVEDDFDGGQVLKGITDDNKFKRGWAAEGLIAGTNITLTGDHTRLLNREAAAGPSNPLVYQGIVKVDADLNAGERELNPQLVVLDDSLERVYRDIEYLGMPAGRDCGFALKFLVPPAGLPAVPALKVRAQIFGLANGTLTDLDTSYNILVRPTVGVPTPIVAGTTPLVMNTAITVAANKMYEVESELIMVQPGDTVYVTINRLAAGSPVYTSEIGLHRFGGIIVDGS